MSNRYSKIATILFSTLIAASACSGQETAVKQVETNPNSFPASSSRRGAEDLTSVTPKRISFPEPSPMAEELSEEEMAASAELAEPTKFSGWMKRGRSRFSAGDSEGALEDYKKAVEQRPESQRAQIQLARTLLNMNEADAAREHAEAALEIDGTSSLAWNTMGRVELLEGSHEAAIASFERATEEDSDNSYAWNNLGFVLIEEGLYDEAVSALEEATTGGTPKAYMWNNLGMAYEHQDEIDLARAAYRQAGNGGSSKALANFERLEGVVSLVASGGNVEMDTEQPEEVALELIEPSPAPIADAIEAMDAGTEADPLGTSNPSVEVAEASVP